jgi:hypothetical protein
MRVMILQRTESSIAMGSGIVGNKGNLERRDDDNEDGTETRQASES